MFSIRMKAVLFAGLLSMCTPSSPSTTTPPAPSVTVDAGPPPSAAPACAAAAQHMIQLSCPPEEDAFGGWIAECSGWPRAIAITSCIQKQTICLGTRQCLGGSP